MGLATLARSVAACLLLCASALPATAGSEANRMLSYLTQSEAEDAADYLAYLIRVFGCEVRREERATFNEAVLHHLAFDFGARLERDADGALRPTEALRRGLFQFSFRAGPHLVERGELKIDREGNARLLTCGALLS
ncbi:MAG: hypothetical protein ACOCYW_09305 [Roseicyclus sp.]